MIFSDMIALAKSLTLNISALRSRQGHSLRPRHYPETIDDKLDRLLGAPGKEASFMGVCHAVLIESENEYELRMLRHRAQ